MAASQARLKPHALLVWFVMLVTLVTLARSFFLSEDISSVKWTMRNTYKHRLRAKSTKDCTENPFDSASHSENCGRTPTLFT